jgi:transposase
MFALPPSVRIFLAPGPTDLRKSFNGLESAARDVLRRDPLSGHLFVFCNRRRNRLKILVFDGSGLWVFAKRLERGTFLWPSERAGVQSMELDAGELALLLTGIDVKQSSRRRWYRRGRRGA